MQSCRSGGMTSDIVLLLLVLLFVFVVQELLYGVVHLIINLNKSKSDSQFDGIKKNFGTQQNFFLGQG